MDYIVVVIAIIFVIILIAVYSFFVAAGYSELKEHVHGTKGLKESRISGKELAIGLGIVLSLLYLSEKCS